MASAGLRAAQPQHRLLLRRPGAGDRRLALEPRQPQRIQGGAGFIQGRQGSQAGFPALDRGSEYKISYTSTTNFNLILAVVLYGRSMVLLAAFLCSPNVCVKRISFPVSADHTVSQL